MSVIAWDGKTLAADRRGANGNAHSTIRKIFRARGGALVGYSGNLCMGEEMRAWFEDGADPAKFPPANRDLKEWCGLIVIEPPDAHHRFPRILRYEYTPYPVEYRDEKVAWGCGSDFATAAMHLGKTAREAVELACLFDHNCGNGVDELTLEKR